MKILCSFESVERPSLPKLAGLRVLMADESVWPTNHPVYCCEVDSSNGTEPGVLQILSDQEADEWCQNEMRLRFNIASTKVREERDRIFATTVDRLNPLRWAELTQLQREEWSAYRQSLKDVTSQPGFPFEVVWPEVPKN